MSTNQTPAAQQSQTGMSRGLKSNFALRIGAVLLAAMPVLFSVTTAPIYSTLSADATRAIRR